MMRLLLCALFVFTCLSCVEKQENNLYLSISPAVELSNHNNAAVIEVLEKFLRTKNDSPTDNLYWVQGGFEKYAYPYLDIYQIENSKHGQNYYLPSLMEIINVDPGTKLLKVAFIGLDEATGQRSLRCIYNILAVEDGGQWKLSKATTHKTRNWQTIKFGSITYLLPPGVEANVADMERQRLDVEQLCAFLDTDPIPITYYSCKDPVQVYEVKGFDYIPNMYISQSGGLAEPGNIVLSGNHSEYYTHEIVHIYTQNLFSARNMLLDEGLATYIGGSGTENYSWHREKFRSHLEKNNLDFSQYLDPYNSEYLNDQTPMSYVVGALICERTLRVFGKEKLLNALASDQELWAILNELGLTKDNISSELTQEIGRSSQPFDKYAGGILKASVQ